MSTGGGYGGATIIIGGGIPVPKIELTPTVNAKLNPSNVNKFLMIDGNAQNYASLPVHSSAELSASFLASDPRLELLVYHAGHRRLNPSSGYHHPTHTPSTDMYYNAPILQATAPVMPPSRSRGGQRSGGVGAVTEWAVGANGHRFMIDTLAQWWLIRPIPYVDVSGNTNFIKLPVLSNRSGYSLGAGKSFGYSPQYSPLYVMFRYSTADPADVRNRLLGPSTRVIRVALARHPFTRDAAATQANQRACVVPQSYLDNGPPWRMQCWWETRLPTSA